MAYAFRIHEPKNPGDPAPMAAATMEGWTQTAHIAGSLLGNIPLGTSSSKMGTSIPSIFARIFLFEGAFQTLKGCPMAKLLQVNSDTKLVSECLDLIEFLYQHGKDPKLVVKHWNATQQIQSLRKDVYPEHTKLAKVLEDEIALYPQLQDIFLFFWKDATPGGMAPREFLIGGTSPYTLVFTSPNWQRCITKNGFKFKRLNGNPLFDTNNIEPLTSRYGEFKDMLYSLRMAYHGTLTNQAPEFLDYITTTWNNEGGPAPTANDPASFMAAFNCIKDKDGADVFSALIPLCYKQVVPTGSGYEIIPKSGRYATYTAHDGTNVNLPCPLALNSNGLTGVPYVGAATWDATSCKINEATIRGQEMHQRVLPGAMGVQYPFLIWSDFLEDKIIKLPYAVDQNLFETAFAGSSPYVLPLKRNFFKYFNIEDIHQVACPGVQKKFVEISANGADVTVTINVPIHDAINRVIQLKKKYSGADIVDGKFLLGFFPFYRSNNGAMNRYSIMNCGSGARLNFVSIGNLDVNVNATSNVRTPNGHITKQTEYYLLRSSFDLVEVTIGGAKGVIVPKMKEVGHAAIANKYKFAVDFGTSNTYIACSTDGGAHQRTFEIGVNNQQTVFLSSTNKIGELSAMSSYMDREFMPVHLGNGFSMSYPTRTATCEIANFENVAPDLFGNISIGFNMMREPNAMDSFKYKTGLKWLLEQHPGDAHHTNRVKYYFLQTLWMLKNESFMNGGDDQFEVYITFPEAMKDKDALMALWNWAKNELGIGCTFFYGTQYSESIAPYNFMAGHIGGSSYLNIDIGGGTSDLLIVNKDGAGAIASAHYSSSIFAADDLWGDGIQIAAGGKLQNGFVDYVLTQIDAAANVISDAVLQPLNALRNGVTTSSADVMGYLFKYDADLNTSAIIRGQRNLYSLVFIHYAALMYNVARLINKLDIDIPVKLSFTGMGSKYINLISTGSNIIKNLTVLLLRKYTGKNVDPAFEIISNPGVDVKEITAKGVLNGLGLHPNFQIPADKLKPVVDYGFDGVDNLTYEDVQTDGVRNAALGSFNNFIASLQHDDFVNFVFGQSGLTISNELIEDLRQFAKDSFVTMSANIPVEHRPLNVTETLFYWPLKNSLVELSKKYQVYS